MTDPGDAAENALRQFADFIEETYSTTVFIPPTPERVAQIHKMFAAEGLSVDQWSAHIARNGANLARAYADRLSSEEW